MDDERIFKIIEAAMEVIVEIKAVDKLSVDGIEDDRK
jgi:hypothetical protein